MSARIKKRQFKTPPFQFQVVDYQSAAFHVQDLHTGTRSVDEDEHVAVLHVTAHLVGHHPAQGIKTPAHIGGVRIQVILHRGGQAEHFTGVPGATTTVKPAYRANCPVLRSPRWDSLSRMKRRSAEHSGCSEPEPGWTEVVAHFQKQPEQTHLWAGVALLACFANNRIWLR